MSQDEKDPDSGVSPGAMSPITTRPSWTRPMPSEVRATGIWPGGNLYARTRTESRFAARQISSRPGQGLKRPETAAGGDCGACEGRPNPNPLQHPRPIQGQGGPGAVEREDTVAQLAGQHQIHPSQNQAWKKALREGASGGLRQR